MRRFQTVDQILRLSPALIVGFSIFLPEGTASNGHESEGNELKEGYGIHLSYPLQYLPVEGGPLGEGRTVVGR